jgi:hypothetical protein
MLLGRVWLGCGRATCREASQLTGRLRPKAAAHSQCDERTATEAIGSFRDRGWVLPDSGISEAPQKETPNFPSQGVAAPATCLACLSVHVWMETPGEC